MKQFPALALAAILALPGAAAIGEEITPLTETLSTQDFEILSEPDGYEAAVAAGLAVIIGGALYFINENDDDDGGTNNTTGTD